MAGVGPQRHEKKKKYIIVFVRKETYLFIYLFILCVKVPIQEHLAS